MEYCTYIDQRYKHANMLSTFPIAEILKIYSDFKHEVSTTPCNVFMSSDIKINPTKYHFHILYNGNTLHINGTTFKNCVMKNVWR